MAIRKLDDYLTIHRDLYDHLNLTDDGIEVLLKGHLLIENILQRILEESSVEPDMMEKAKLGFHKKVIIVRALHGDKCKPWVWECVLETNVVRNRLAHYLENPGIEERIDDLIDKIRMDDVGFVNAGSEFDFSGLPMAIMSMHHELWTIFDQI